MISRSFPFALLLAASCAPPKPAPMPTLPQGQLMREHPMAPAALPDGPDVGREMMGYLLVHDGDKLAQELNPGSRVSTSEVAKSLGLDGELAKALDLRRPMVLAMLNPSLLSTAKVRPYVALLPVSSEKALLHALARKGTITTTPWGAEWMTTLGRVYIGFDRGYAIVAWRKDLLGPAEKLLRPRLAERLDAPVRLHLELSNLYSSYGPQIEQLASRFAVAAAQGGASNDPQLTYGLRQVRTLAPYIQSFSAVDVDADLDSGGLTLSVGVEGKPGGAWAEYVRQQRPGPAWGVRFLPRDAVLAYTTTASPMGRANDLTALVDYMSSLSAGDQGRWKSALEKAVGSTEGELAWAVWPGKKGGVGMGGAYRLSDPGGAREAINAAYREVASPLPAMVLRGLSLDPARFAKRVSVVRKQARIAGVDADLFEVSVRWPAGSDAERRTFESMFGPRLVMATTFLDEQALFVLGADYGERLAAMIKVAQGEGGASLGDEPAFVEALSYRDHDRVSLTYLDTVKMAHFAASLMAQARELGPAQQAAMTALLAEVGTGAIVSTTNAKGSRYQLTTHLPPGAVAGAAQLHGALWRIALSPLVNPPMMPPLPVPPPQVAPTKPAGTSL
jgi:hypothetical protein